MQECYFDPDKVIIYKRKKQSNDIWYVRILRKEGGYLIRSLKTKQQAIALDRAKETWTKLLLAEEKNIIYGKTNFNNLFDDFVKGLHSSKVRQKKIEYTGEKYLKPFFGKYDIQTIENDKWEKYLIWRITYWDRAKENGVHVPPNAKTPSQTTLLHERQVIRQFLNWCKDKHYLHSVPRLRVWIDDLAEGKTISTGKTRGNAMTTKRYKQIDNMLRREAFKNPDTNKARRYSKFMLYYMTKIIYHSLIRPIKKEMGMIKWKNIDIRQSKKKHGGYVAIISLDEGKRKGKPMIYMTTYRGTLFLLRWRKYCIEYGLGRDDDYVFSRYSGKMMTFSTTGHHLRNRLIVNNLRENVDGTDITLYSYRATGITQRIRDGKDIGSVSKSANTSIKSISESYHTEFMKTNIDRFADNWEKGKENIRDIAIKRDNEEMEELITWTNNVQK